MPFTRQTNERNRIFGQAEKGMAESYSSVSRPAWCRCREQTDAMHNTSPWGHVCLMSGRCLHRTKVRWSTHSEVPSHATAAGAVARHCTATLRLPHETAKGRRGYYLSGMVSKGSSIRGRYSSISCRCLSSSTSDALHMHQKECVVGKTQC